MRWLEPMGEVEANRSVGDGPIQGCYEISRPASQDSWSWMHAVMQPGWWRGACGARSMRLVEVGSGQGGRSSRCGCYCFIGARCGA
jgi:hypothetical protein